MGKRRGRTGPGGAVVSSLSDNAGGKVTSNRRGGPQGSQRRGREDLELAELANPSGQGKGKKNNAGPPSSGSQAGASGSLSAPSAAPKWLGKSPSQMLREWCTKSNRKRPYFSKMNGSEVYRCTVPPGRKDGKKAKGNAFDIVVGVGAHPGEEYAALNVLHQVERGKPLERLLAPEFRNVWLDLDKRFAEVEAENTQRTMIKEKRKEQAVRRAKFEKSKESATINISAASRQLIEEAIAEHKSSNGDRTGPPRHAAVERISASGSSGRNKQSLKQELVSMGFSKFDAIDSCERFSDVTSALDYLCLNLDEAELPASFAPTADVEVVQFSSGSKSQNRGRIDTRARDILTNLTCLSKHAAERSLRATHGELDRSMVQLYNTLTHNLLAEQMFFKLEESITLLAREEKISEGETISAIYGEDAIVGVGAMPGLENKWAAVIRLEGGFPAIGFRHLALVAFVDMDGLYPISAPVVIVGTDFSDSGDVTEKLSTSYRRILMRAAAGELASIRGSFGAADNHFAGEPVTAAVIHGVVTFLTDANDTQLMSSAASKSGTNSVWQTERVTEDIDALKPMQNEQEASLVGVSGKSSKRRRERPMMVGALRPSAGLSAMQKRRASLPAHNSRAEILASVRNNQVVVVSGATGSGKTTQVPQFLLEEAAEAREPICIVCTQPRRIAAMSVAERVAAERCQKVGESVGYQVKLNSRRSKDTRLMFCTTGVLLRRLQGDPQLDSLTHVLVDEVHERSVETDFLLLLLREIAARRPDIRVVLMSATLDAEKFSAYFSSALSTEGKRVSVPVISIPGRTFPVDEFYLQQAVGLTSYCLRPGDRYTTRSGKIAHKGKYGPEPPPGAVFPKVRNAVSATAMGAEYVAMDDSRHEDVDRNRGSSWDATESNGVYREAPMGTGRNAEGNRTVAIIDESVVNVDLIDLLVKKIDLDDRKMQHNGAILIFLPGVADISAVIRKLASGPGSECLWPLPLHSLLSPDEQNRVFSKPPKGKRKVICSTNVAETSITVEDVTFVIDTLRAKEMGYDALNGCSVLEEGFISKAAAKQRAGRAGRVSKGSCYRLVREETFENRFKAQQTPEIQRVALEHLVLHMLSIIPEHQSENDPHLFLGRAIDPPAPQSIKTAVDNLIDIGALRFQDSSINALKKVELTALGRHLTGLPVDARIGKLLIFGSLFSCMDAALTIAATISERSPFLSPFDKRDEARAARAPFVWGKSDLLTYVKAFSAWRDVRESKRGYAFESEFCSKNFLARKTLMAISDGRKQLADALADAGFGLPGLGKAERGWEQDSAMNTYSGNVRVVKAVVCAALYPHVARIDLPDTTYHEVASGAIANKYHSKDLRLRSKGGERLFLHPESVNFHEGNYETRWLAYFAKVKTSRVFVRDSTMVSPYAILLFGGDIEVQHKKGQMSVDKWMIFKAPARVAVLARELRRQLDGLLMRKFEDADVDLAQEGKAVNEAIIRLLTTES